MLRPLSNHWTPLLHTDNDDDDDDEEEEDEDDEQNSSCPHTNMYFFK